MEYILNPWAEFEDQADTSIPTATLQIYDYIDEYLKRNEETYIHRASAATLCFKQRWYKGRNTLGTPLTPRKMVNFLLGDLSEKTILYFVKNACVGSGKLYSEVDFGKVIGSFTFQGKLIEIYEQETLHMPMGKLDITAHVDGWGKRNLDGKWELIECKSAANWGFNDFKEVGAKDYLKQAHVCMATYKAKALGVDQVRYFYLRKETGHLWDRVFDFDQNLLDTVIHEYELADSEKEPVAPYLLINETMRGKPTGRKIAGFPCSYCAYLRHCKGAYIKDWKKDQFQNMKPIFVF